MSHVIYTIRDRVAYLEMNRPEKRNAINADLISELIYHLTNANNDSAVRVVVLTGKGDCFSAGADLSYLQTLQKNSYEQNLADSNQLLKLFKLLHNVTKLTIAQVNGHAIAGGCGLVTACDMAFSVPQATFGYTEVKIGFVPAIVMPLLIKKVGEGKARELMLTGNVISAQEAKQSGLINWLIDDVESLNDKVFKFAIKFSQTTSGNSVRLIKQMMHDTDFMPMNAAMEHGANLNAKSRSSEDCKKGIDYFLRKERLDW